MSLCEHGPHGKCGRRAVRITPTRMCGTHRRWWLAGKPLDTEPRDYQRYEEGPDGKITIRAPRAPSPRRKPFEKEYALLRSLGLA